MGRVEGRREEVVRDEERCIRGRHIVELSSQLLPVLGILLLHHLQILEYSIHVHHSHHCNNLLFKLKLSHDIIDAGKHKFIRKV